MTTNLDNKASNNTGENKKVERPQYLSNNTQKDMIKNRKSLPLEGGISYKIGGMCTIKYDIISTKFY